MDSVVEIELVTKRYGAVEALRGVSLRVPRGCIFGLLGPNGAGKTTLVEILEGMREEDSGTVRVCGLSPKTDNVALHRKLGAQLQATALPDAMKVSEAFALFAQLYDQPASRVPPLLKRFDLERLLTRRFSQLSGGEKQRLAVALALINDPELVILDEPTAALDPSARADVHTAIGKLREEGRSVILCTHYLEEAQKLCDQLVILARGQVVGLGTTATLLEQSRRAVELTLLTGRALGAQRWQSLAHVRVLREAGNEVTLALTPPTDGPRPGALVAMVCELAQREAGGVVDLSLQKPTLDDVFFELTGEQVSA